MYARNLDSELEKLREQALEPANVEKILLSVLLSAEKIHVSWLFEKEGLELLQKLCLLISATASNKSYGDWQKFAARLGLSTEQIRCIDYNFKGLQDPTYYVLLAFAQNAEGTMDKLFKALQKSERLDVINRTADSFDKFFQEIVQKQKINNGVYKPKLLPRAPLVLSPPIKCQQDSQQETRVIGSSSEQKNLNNTENKKYGSIVMLTFAEDGSKTADEIKKIFRSCNPKIGVFVLQEQEKLVYSKAEEVIDDCFKQVDYIVPILTEEYLTKLNSNDCNNFYSLDSKYIRYIYSLMRYEYIKQDCVNNRIRCIIPDKEVNKVLSMDLHPTFQAWFRESDVHLFAERILLKKF